MHLLMHRGRDDLDWITEVPHPQAVEMIVVPRLVLDSAKFLDLVTEPFYAPNPC
jgi:hypothetical protein